jgi:hypothetical protein
MGTLTAHVTFERKGFSALLPPCGSMRKNMRSIWKARSHYEYIPQGVCQKKKKANKNKWCLQLGYKNDDLSRHLQFRAVDSNNTLVARVGFPNSKSSVSIDVNLFEVLISDSLCFVLRCHTAVYL